MSTERFINDMEAAGLTVEPYRGRFFWTGPAVRVDDIQDVLSATRVRCQWDSIGLGYIVYPERSDQAWFEAYAAAPGEKP